MGEVININRNTKQITIIAIGGGGCNALNRMAETNPLPAGVRIIAIDSKKLDPKDDDLANVTADTKIYLSAENLFSESGQEEIESKFNDIDDDIKPSSVVFIIAGLGGTVGSSASPVVAKLCAQKNAFSIAAFSTPFSFEGHNKKSNASLCIENCKQYVSALFVLSNDILLKISGENLNTAAALAITDNYRSLLINRVATIISKAEQDNLSLADLKEILINETKQIQSDFESGNLVS